MKRVLFFLFSCYFAIFFAGIYDNAVQTAIPKVSYQIFSPKLKYTEELKGFVICVDPGHGGERFNKQYKTGVYTGGTQTKNGDLTEGDANLKTALYLKHFLESAGATVVMTRRDDRRVTSEIGSEKITELAQRVVIAENAKAHFFISLHHNWVPNPKSSGSLTIYYKGKASAQGEELSKRLAQTLLEYVVKAVPPHINRGIKYRSYAITSRARIPLTIVEFGYFSNPEFVKWLKTKSAPFIEAKAVFKGVLQYVKENKKELLNYHKQLFGTEYVFPSKKTDKDYLINILPDKKYPQKFSREFLKKVIENYKNKYLSDKSLFYVSSEILPDNGKYKIILKVDHPFIAKRIKNILSNLEGVDIETKVLPEKGIPKYGVVKAETALTWSKPGEDTGVQSQLLMGEYVWILDKKNGYLLVHNSDGYLGWVREDAIKYISEKDFNLLVNAEKVIVKNEFTYKFLRFDPGEAFPYIYKDDKNVFVILPMGDAANLSVNNFNFSKPIEERVSFKAMKKAIDFLYTPYLFGGLSKMGCDCSGLVVTCYKVNGVQLARDTRMQILNGKMVATYYNMKNIQPGDLLFFLGANGRVFHVGIALDNKRFIHQSPPATRINSLDPEDKLFVPIRYETFYCAKRIFF